MLFVLQICGFVTYPSGPIVGAEALFALSTLTAGGVLFVTAFIISKLQLASDVE